MEFIPRTLPPDPDIAANSKSRFSLRNVFGQTLRAGLRSSCWIDAVMGLPPASSEAGRLSLRVMVCGMGSDWLGPEHHRGTAMDHYVGIDVSLELSSLCVLDAAGQIVREAKVASDPEALIGFLTGLALPLTRIGLEAGPLSQWLHA